MKMLPQFAWTRMARMVQMTLITLSTAALVACGGGEPVDGTQAASPSAAQSPATELAPLAAIAPRAAAAAPLSAPARTVDANAFMDWAQTVLPAIFPGAQPTLERTGFVVRYYPASGNFLAVTTAGDAFALGPVTGGALVSLGNVSVFACSIYPDSCQAEINSVRSLAPLSYGKVAVLEVTGEGLDRGISLVAPGCGNLSELAGSTATQRRYNCTVNAPTALAVDALRGDGTTAVTASFSVPAPQVTMTTSMGTIVLELNPLAAPLSVDNFLKYTNDGFYANLLFHRVISSFVIQGGGVTTKPEKKLPTYAPIKLESNNGLSNLRGTLAMARTSVPDSATSEFFINVVDNLFLNYASAASPGYAVFGKVVQGLDVVDRIRVVPTMTRTTDPKYPDFPVTDVVIQSATQTR